MPIRTEHKRFYEGEAWQAVRRQVLRRAEDKCECTGQCGKHARYRCARANRSDYWSARGLLVRVNLQVAHIDNDCTHQDVARLLAVCAECHLGMDHELHMRNGAATRREKLNNLELPL